MKSLILSILMVALCVLLCWAGVSAEEFVDGINPDVTSSDFGKVMDLATTTTFKRSDGSNFTINCTVAAAFNSSGGAFSTGSSITILNVGVATITFDGMHAIQAGQRGVFIFDGIDFQGGV